MKEIKKIKVTVSFSSEPENPKDLADFFLLLNQLDKEQNGNNQEVGRQSNYAE